MVIDVTAVGIDQVSEDAVAQSEEDKLSRMNDHQMNDQQNGKGG